MVPTLHVGSWGSERVQPLRAALGLTLFAASLFYLPGLRALESGSWVSRLRVRQALILTQALGFILPLCPPPPWVPAQALPTPMYPALHSPGLGPAAGPQRAVEGWPWERPPQRGSPGALGADGLESSLTGLVLTSVQRREATE